MAFDLRLSKDSDLPDLRRLSALARDRYKTIPSLAHVADLPPLSADRFEACRVVVAVDQNTHEVIGYAAMRPRLCKNYCAWQYCVKNRRKMLI